MHLCWQGVVPVMTVPEGDVPVVAIPEGVVDPVVGARLGLHPTGEH